MANRKYVRLSSLTKAPSQARKPDVLSRRRRSPSHGFTLVEVLTVVIIIGILMGMLFVAFGRASIAARNAAMKSDSTQLVQAMEAFRTQCSGNEYPPDGTNTADTQRFIRMAFPRCLPANLANMPTLNPSTALVFWLGGYQDATGKFIGLSADPTNPFDATATSRVGPFYDFDKNHIYKTGTNLFQYYPPNSKPLPAAGATVPAGSYSPYLYFKAVGGTYATTSPAWSATWKDPNGFTISPFVTSANTAVWVNPTSYQLLCPGLDGLFATVGKGQTTDSKAPQYPAGSNYYPAVQDDITNFTNNSTVGGDMP